MGRTPELSNARTARDIPSAYRAVTPVAGPPL